MPSEYSPLCNLPGKAYAWGNIYAVTERFREAKKKHRREEPCVEERFLRGLQRAGEDREKKAQEKVGSPKVVNKYYLRR